MRFDRNPKYKTIAFYACCVLLFAAILVFLIINSSGVVDFIYKGIAILNPVIVGFVIAFLINPVMRFCEEKIFKSIGKKNPGYNILRRTLSLVLAVLIVAFVITAFVLIMVPQIVASYNEFMDKISVYVIDAQQKAIEIISGRGRDILPGWLQKFVDVDKLAEQAKDLIGNWYKFVLDLTPNLLTFLSNLINNVKNTFIGIVFSIYFLLRKEMLCAQVKKVVYALFNRNKADNIAKVTNMTKVNFEGFVVGKVIDSLIMGVITFIVFMIFDIPYYPLLSIIICVTNIIPFFGPIIGGVPSALIVLISNPSKLLLVIILIVVIQQLDGNVIGPMILGKQTNLSAVWVMFAITFMGGILGLTGMFIGVPLMAVLYALFAEFIHKRLKSKDMSVSYEAYIGPDGVGDKESLPDEIRNPGPVDDRTNIKKLKDWVKTKSKEKKE